MARTKRDGTYLRVELGKEETKLFENLAGLELGESDEELGEHARALVILRAETLAGDVAEDFVAELKMIKVAREDMQTVGHVLGEMLVVLKGLYDGDLRGGSVLLVLDGVADGLVDALPDSE